MALIFSENIYLTPLLFASIYCYLQVNATGHYGPHILRKYLFDAAIICQYLLLFTGKCHLHDKYPLETFLALLMSLYQKKKCIQKLEKLSGKNIDIQCVL